MKKRLDEQFESLYEICSIEEDLNKIRKSLFIKMITEGVDDPGILKCVFLAGGPGSGKSYTAKEVFGVGKDLVQSFSAGGLKLVGSDIAFEKSLKDNGINPKDLAKIEKEDPELWGVIMNTGGIRSTASKLTQYQRSFYEAGRLGMIFDGTGDIYEKIKKRKERVESLGYDSCMLFVNTSLEVAKERNRKRERVLSDELLTRIWKDSQDNLGKFQQLFSGNLIIIDNTKYGPIERHIQKAIDRFIRQPVQNHIGRQWIKTARELKKRNLIK